jgi:site-specific recombinase XerD
LDLARGRQRYIRSWAIVDVLTSTGIRASECRFLKIGDLSLGKREPLMKINGKGKKVRLVNIPAGLRKHLVEFLQWKKLVNDGVDENDYLFPSSKQGQPFSLGGLQTRFKALAKEAGIAKHHSLHSCRHSYAVYLYQKTKNLRLIQRELGHSNIATTTIYADVTAEQCAESVNGLW